MTSLLTPDAVAARLTGDASTAGSQNALITANTPSEFGNLPVSRSRYGSLDAVKQESRQNAARTSEKEEQQWQTERQGLLDIKYEKGLTNKQERRLRYVEWMLNTIEEARVGPALDDLESITERIEEFRDGVLEIVLELQKKRKSRR